MRANTISDVEDMYGFAKSEIDESYDENNKLGRANLNTSAITSTEQRKSSNIDDNVTQTSLKQSPLFQQRRVYTNTEAMGDSRGLRQELNLVIENGTHDSLSDRGGRKE